MSASPLQKVSYFNECTHTHDNGTQHQPLAWSVPVTRRGSLHNQVISGKYTTLMTSWHICQTDMTNCNATVYCLD